MVWRILWGGAVVASSVYLIFALINGGSSPTARETLPIMSVISGTPSPADGELPNFPREYPGMTMSDWVYRLQRYIDTNLDASRLNMTTFVLSQHCLRQYALTQARDEFHQRALLADQTVVLDDRDFRKLLRCVFAMGVRLR